MPVTDYLHSGGGGTSHRLTKLRLLHGMNSPDSDHSTPLADTVHTIFMLSPVSSYSTNSNPGQPAVSKVDRDHPMDSNLDLECGTDSDLDGDYSDETDDNDEGPGDCYYSNSMCQVEYTNVSDYEDSATGSENEFPASASLVCITFIRV